MFVTRSYPDYTRMATTPEVRSSVHIPMVYEQVASAPINWEYHVLTIDPREAPLPDAEQLNALGRDGWILVGLLDEAASGKGHLVHYYFARQAKD
ncbi:MAG TPA: hypothetical protein VFB12_30360 [Ktedonobacteraceae bacterium]|nr:hypothetical protein [Ktedonobacteraceae bacterium]